MSSSGGRKASDRPTMRMCRFISGAKGPCYGSIAWYLEKTNGGEAGFYVCDAHLAAGSRLAGLPARIELHENDRDEDTPTKPFVVRCTAQ